MSAVVFLSFPDALPCPAVRDQIGSLRGIKKGSAGGTSTRRARGTDRPSPRPGPSVFSLPVSPARNAPGSVSPEDRLVEASLWDTYNYRPSRGACDGGDERVTGVSDGLGRGKTTGRLDSDERWNNTPRKTDILSFSLEILRHEEQAETQVPRDLVLYLRLSRLISLSRSLKTVHHQRMLNPGQAEKLLKHAAELIPHGSGYLHVVRTCAQCTGMPAPVVYISPQGRGRMGGYTAARAGGCRGVDVLYCNVWLLTGDHVSSELCCMTDCSAEVKKEWMKCHDIWYVDTDAYLYLEALTKSAKSRRR
ncbi:hypothetical protein Bbelb_218340 [Branchiostoma belcheri]|nr:hypothetical protein Bbelb_218340 [Branchiostoma belcheri]